MKLSRALCLVVLVAAATTAFIGCDSSNPDDGNTNPSALSGTFDGPVAATNDSVSVRISIFEAADNPVGGKSIGGTGTITTPGEVSTFDIDGTYVHPLVELNLQFGDRPMGTISGRASDSRLQISGTIAAPGIGGQITLRKLSA